VDDDGCSKERSSSSVSAPAAAKAGQFQQAAPDPACMLDETFTHHTMLCTAIHAAYGLFLEGLL